MRHVKHHFALCVAAAGLACAAAAQPNDPLGSVKIAKGQPVTIGWWLAMTGPAAGLGLDSRRAIELAIESKGKVLGHPIRLVGEDSACDPQRAGDAAAKLAAVPALLAVVGPSCSGEALAGVPVLWRSGIAAVSPSNTAIKLTVADRGAAFDGYLRTAHNDKVQGRIAAEFAFNALKATKAATLHDGGAYGEGLVAAFAETFKRLGGSVVAHETITPAQADMRPQLARLANAAPEVVYYPLSDTAVVSLTQQARQTPALAKASLLTGDGAFLPDFVRSGGEAAKGVYLTSPDLAPAALGPKYATFVAAYQEKYGAKPASPFHAQAYDATRMIVAAIESVARADADGNLVVGRKALRDALFATRGLAGLSGTITCDAHGDCADAKIAVYQVQSADASTWDPGRNPKRIYP